MSEELKPCPFCGGEVYIDTPELDRTGEPCYFQILCDCQILMEDDDWDELAKRWNTRKWSDHLPPRQRFKNDGAEWSGCKCPLCHCETLRNYSTGEEYCSFTECDYRGEKSDG